MYGIYLILIKIPFLCLNMMWKFTGLVFIGEHRKAMSYTV